MRVWVVAGWLMMAGGTAWGQVEGFSPGRLAELRAERAAFEREQARDRAVRAAVAACERGRATPAQEALLAAVAAENRALAARTAAARAERQRRADREAALEAWEAALVTPETFSGPAWEAVADRFVERTWRRRMAALAR
jgi:hypothetical protein